MTTRAGAAGLLTGLIATVMIFLFFIIQPDAFLGTSSEGSTFTAWIAAAIVTLLITGGGWIAARRSGSVIPWRRTVLGALAGALAGTVLFCLWGAAAAGQAGWFLPDVIALGVNISKAELVSAIVERTLVTFLAFFLGGAGLGALGGWVACPRRSVREDTFNRNDPQMVLNVSITAVPASMLAVVIAAAAFKNLPESVAQAAAYLPLITALMLLIISLLALTLVVPHETRHAVHRCGMDEIKMAAFVGMAAAPVLLLALFLADAASLSNPLVIITVVTCWVLSIVNVFLLVRVVLPKRASFPAPLEVAQKTEAVLFGTIAFSRAPRLVMLCTGCGLAMAQPLYVSVLSVLVNLEHFQLEPGLNWALFKEQALVSVGISAAAVGALVLIYMLYLNLGRWWSKREK